MRSIAMTVFATCALAIAPLAAEAASITGSSYVAKDLMSPCQEADNDSRWGAAAEVECEQYIMGFVDAMAEVGALGPDAGICLPETNVADEVRWAFMRWVHTSYTKNIAMPAADALLETLKASFPCDSGTQQ